MIQSILVYDTEQDVEDTKSCRGDTAALVYDTEKCGDDTNGVC
ncbi:hypothetical protein [Marinifilum sp. D714]|nr:hypothetical protein [Marinifilum sp. D714]